MSLRDWSIIFILGIAWGSSFMFNAVLLEQIGPLSVAAGRIALGALTCWAYVIATGRMTRLSPALLGNALVLGLVAYAVPFSLYPIAQAHIASGITGIINAMTPIMVVIVSHVWPGGERATALKSGGVLFGFAGIVLLAWPALQRGGSSEIWALVTAWGATLGYAFGLNWVRRIKGLHPSVLAALSLSLGAVVLIPVALATEGVPALSDARHWGAMLILGVLLTGVAFLVLWELNPRIGATNTSIVTFIAPISAVSLGVLVLGETLALAHLLGGFMILCGLMLIDGRILRRAKAQPSG